MLFVHKMAEHPNETAELGECGSQRSTTDSPMENENEQWCQAKIDTDRKHARIHRLFGITGGTHYIVQPQKITAEQAAHQYDMHEVPGVGQRFFTGPESRQNVIQKPMMKFKIKVLPKMFVASSVLFWPIRMDIMADAPAPIMAPKAIIKFIKGMVKANPEIAYGPTPFPMKMRSITLYSEETVMPKIAGSE